MWPLKRNRQQINSRKQKIKAADQQKQSHGSDHDAKAVLRCHRMAALDKRRLNRREACALIGKLVGAGIAFAQDMGQRYAAGKQAAQRQRLGLERFQMRRVDFVAPFHLPGHQLAVRMHRHPRRAPRPRFFQTPNERFVFGHIVGRLPDAFPNLRNCYAVGVGQKNADARRAGVAFGSAVNK